MIEQLSVFIQNEPGKLAAITRVLAQGGIDLRALSIADTNDFGVLRVLVSDVQKAKEILSKNNFVYSVTNVAVVAVEDAPGGLSSLLETLSESGVNIEYMYSLIGRTGKQAYMVFRISDEEKLMRVFSQKGLQTVSAEELGIR